MGLVKKWTVGLYVQREEKLEYFGNSKRSRQSWTGLKHLLYTDVIKYWNKIKSENKTKTIINWIDMSDLENMGGMPVNPFSALASEDSQSC